LAIQMIAEVQRVRGQRIPLAWLFESSTIASLAARLAARQFAEPEPPLVVLQGDTTGPPIAFVHGDWTGGGWYVRRLAPLVAPNSPFYVLPTVGEDEAQQAWTIEAIAARHLLELRQVQPQGPYRLVGFCISGVIAYEMACQLIAAGEQVDKLIVVDGGPANARLRFSRPLLRWIPGNDVQQLARRAAVLGRLRWMDLQMRKFRSHSLLTGMRWAARATARRVPILRDLFRLEPPDADELAAGARDGLDEQAIEGRVQQRAAEAYVPERYPGTLDFLWAEGPPGGYPRPNPVERWRLVAREVRLRAIPSGHIGLVTENLPLFAAALRETLERPS
ncbi:MAG: thioesterase domain-containing protein, partial [Gemmatimonadales bacterium]